MAKQPGKFSSKPDYVYWAQMARWVLDEAVKLSLDLDPFKVTPETIESPGFPAELKQQILKRQTLIENHMNAGWLPRYPSPDEFLEWAQGNSVVECPATMIAAVEAIRGRIADWRHQAERSANELNAAKERIRQLEAEQERLQSSITPRSTQVVERTDENPLHPKERQSLLKMVLGMAIEYGFDPLNEGNTSATSAIYKALSRNHISLDQDTIKKYLRLAAEEVVEE